ncbi:MAG: LTA synthase family protein [Pygmaiobacter sp.]|nr:LTA synthase family protein [Pygmaiobacter sp.]
MSISSLILGFIAVLIVQSHMVISSFGFAPNVWDPTASMMKNGFLVNFFASVTTQHVSKPAGYSGQKIESLSEEFPSDSLNSLSSTVRPNIIVIMNESWTDFSLTTDLKTNKDPQPFLHSLEQDKNVRFGKLVMPVFGAGTVMSEFEFLTGATAQSYPNGAPYTTYVKQGTPSLVSTVKQLGYYAVAMHPNLASNWNRDIGYKKFGFDQFLSLDDFKNIEVVRSWPSDQSTYENIIRITQETPDPLFLFCVTMQNHGSYANSEYKSEVRIKYPNGDYPMAEQYLGLLSESDKAFEGLVNYYSSQEEPTIVLMFGDHLPALEETLYNKLFQDGDVIDRYTTPYVIWSNLEAQDFDFEAEYLSVPYLSSLLMGYSGLPTTGFYKYMQNQALTYPVISLRGSSLSEIYNMDEDDQKKYEFVQYDIFSSGIEGGWLFRYRS